MSRLKVKCATCGKVFAPAHVKLTLCPDCEKTQRAARAQKRAEANVPVQTRQPTAPHILGPGARALLPVTPTVEIPVTGSAPAASSTTSANADTVDAQARRPEPYAQSDGALRAGQSGVQRQSGPRTHRAAPPPLALSEALRQQIEERYLALANPVEFDGIRAQIATELGAPKPAVRAVVRELRQRRGMPSWWELQGFAGTSVDLERIRSAYTPYLPLPPVGVHRAIADLLGLEPRTVYRGIRKIRALLGLPQYNAPGEHPERAAAAITSDAGEGTAHL
jgi:hypothetical protein